MAWYFSEFKNLGFLFCFEWGIYNVLFVCHIALETRGFHKQIVIIKEVIWLLTGNRIVDRRFELNNKNNH